MMSLFNCILVFSQMVVAWSFADWMTKDFCDRPLLVDEIIMNNKVVASSERLIQVFRNGVELKTGSTYVPGETLDVSLQDDGRRGQQVFECTTNAKFDKGGCGGIRIAKSNNKLIISADTKEPVTLTSGWAHGHEEVKLAPVFVLFSAAHASVSPPNISTSEDGIEREKRELLRLESKQTDSKSDSESESGGEGNTDAEQGNEIESVSESSEGTKPHKSEITDKKYMEKSKIVKKSSGSLKKIESVQALEARLESMKAERKAALHSDGAALDGFSHKNHKFLANHKLNGHVSSAKIGEIDPHIELPKNHHGKRHPNDVPKQVEVKSDPTSLNLKLHKTAKLADKEILRAALRGEDLNTGLFDPALKHTHSTAYYIIFYCLIVGVLLLILYLICFDGQSSYARTQLKHYLRRVRGKATNKSAN